MKEDIKICAYNTHYALENYELGDSRELEKDLSVWNGTYFRADPYYYYDAESKTLYIPKGYDASKLHDFINKPIHFIDTCNPYNKATFSMKVAPRNDVQKESIRFLIGKEEYAYTLNNPQLVLSLPGGGGKTYCTIAACSMFEMKTIIVCHNSQIRKQWAQRLASYTNLATSSIVTLTSTKTMHSYLDASQAKKVAKQKIYLATHSVLRNYMKAYGFHSLNELFIALGIGIKVFDEAHKEFNNILMVDYATNVFKTFYLTATFARTDRQENRMFQTCFNRIYKLKKTSEDLGVEKNVVYIASIYNSMATYMDIVSMKTKKGINKMLYTDYQMKKHHMLKDIVKWVNWYYCIKGFDGITFILSAKKSSCDYICEQIKDRFPEKRTCVHYTGNKVDNFEDYDIICATAQMFDTGTDINDLKMIINTEPIGSAVNADQIVHRLMRGNDNTTRFFIDVIDKSIVALLAMAKKRRQTFNKFVKQTIIIDPSVKKRNIQDE